MTPDDITEVIRGMGGCGAISPDGKRACVQKDGHPEKHPWDDIAGPVYVSCGTESCGFCPAPVLPENADRGWPCRQTGKPMARVQ